MRGNSVRLRLTRREVEQFDKTGLVEEIVDFGPASPAFHYELRTSDASSAFGARFDNDRLSISIPIGQANNWAVSEQIGLEATQPIGDNRFLTILVEKDFACLAPRENEDESDAFVNPSVRSTSG